MIQGLACETLARIQRVCPGGSPRVGRPNNHRALVVLEGPEMRMFRKAAARPVRDKVSALASKNPWAARA